ncbi:hypothetical protein M405DRAFT_806569, partial [Rhizopogon salebrosus TDB-379]
TKKPTTNVAELIICRTGNRSLCTQSPQCRSTTSATVKHEMRATLKELTLLRSIVPRVGLTALMTRLVVIM